MQRRRPSLEGSRAIPPCSPNAFEAASATLIGLPYKFKRAEPVPRNTMKAYAEVRNRSRGQTSPCDVIPTCAASTRRRSLYGAIAAAGTGNRPSQRALAKSSSSCSAGSQWQCGIQHELGRTIMRISGFPTITPVTRVDWTRRRSHYRSYRPFIVVTRRRWRTRHWGW